MNAIEASADFIMNVIEQAKPIGKFYFIESGIYVSLDNSTGEAWTEEFKTKKEAVDWLENL